MHIKPKLVGCHPTFLYTSVVRRRYCLVKLNIQTQEHEDTCKKHDGQAGFFTALSLYACSTLLLRAATPTSLSLNVAPLITCTLLMHMFSGPLLVIKAHSAFRLQRAYARSNSIPQFLNFSLKTNNGKNRYNDKNSD